MSGIQLLTPRWTVSANVRAAFTLRAGGVSVPPFDSLNLGSQSGDEPAAVDENRRRLRDALTLPSEPAWMDQVHGADVVDLDTVAPGTLLRADGAVARTRGRICVVRVADCMPVLFADRAGTAVGAAHAGWRGLVGGVLEATVTAMRLDAARLSAWMGPAIGPAHFEVGDEVREAFNAHDPRAISAFTPNERGRWQCDLYALARQRLEAFGVGEITGGGWCTYAEARQFYSYRRDSRTGRMAALIWLE